MSDYFWIFLRLAIGFIFAYAGFMKLIAPIENFQATIADFNAFPPSIIPWIAKIVPWIELIGGTFLLLGYLPKISSLVISALALAFVMLLGVSVLAGKGAESCGCFGESGITLSRNQMFVLDLLSCMACLKFFITGKFPLSLESRLNRR